MLSKALEKFLSNYGGIKDPNLRVMKLLKNNYEIKRVLYPGSWIHLTPSLVFHYVVYVDNIAKMESMLSDPELLEYIGTNSEIYGEAIIKVYQMDYRDEIPEEKTSFDLLISLSSGFVSQYCGSYLKKNGILFVNNEHYDATKAFVDKDFSPIGIFTYAGKLIHQPKSIQEYFLTKKNEIITSEMVTENSKRSPSKSKYKLKKESPILLI